MLGFPETDGFLFWNIFDNEPTVNCNLLFNFAERHTVRLKIHTDALRNVDGDWYQK